MKKLLTLATLTLACFSATQSFADSKPADNSALKSKVELKVPALMGHIKTITPINVWDLYEIDTDDHQVIYVDKEVKYFFSGSLYQADKMINLTQERLDILNAVDWKTLPLSTAIKRVKGNGKRQMVIFSDPDCPYCRKLEEEIKGLDNVTIYTFLFPITELHPEAALRSTQIWCAKDKAKAWDDYMLTQKIDNENTHCDTSTLTKHHQLGEKLGIQGTPGIIFKNGKKVEGAIPSDQINAELDAK